MADFYLGLGSNLGDKVANLREALRLLVATRGSEVTLLAVSSLYRTEPVGNLEQDWFLNAAAKIKTKLSPRGLLNRLLAIERELGRVRTVPNGPRIIDLDILLWDRRIVKEDDLVIPHPRMHKRLFVLDPLAELAPDLRHPILRQTVAECRAELALESQDEAAVVRIDGPWWVLPRAH
jgi:2-amino-4-hydroxy-6-hydroxymethyldihydropteridine diphosphokinase